MLKLAGSATHPEMVTETRLSSRRYANQVGKEDLKIAQEKGNDKIVMSHHSSGSIGRPVIGSAAWTVGQAAEPPPLPPSSCNRPAFEGVSSNHNGLLTHPVAFLGSDR